MKPESRLVDGLVTTAAAPQSLAEYLVWCESAYRVLGVDQDEIVRLRTMLRERMTETRIAMTAKDADEYDALAAREAAG